MRHTSRGSSKGLLLMVLFLLLGLVGFIGRDTGHVGRTARPLPAWVLTLDKTENLQYTLFEDGSFIITGYNEEQLCSLGE